MDKISIHTLLTECDLMPFVLRGVHGKFQSTHSLRSVTQHGVGRNREVIISIHTLLTECDMEGVDPDQLTFDISIHTLLTECDALYKSSGCLYPDFNPHTPYGV